MGLDLSDIGRLGAGAQRQIMDKLTGKPPKKSKYHARKAQRGSLTFDSQKEARRYDELMLLYQEGMIAELKLQPEFTLQEAFTTPTGKKVQAIRYRADFSYRTKTGGYIVEDVKGVRTDVYALKRKMVLDKYGIEIVEV